MTRVVALVPAKDGARSVAATVAALRASEVVDEVVVIDDGSTDATAAEGRAAGARVLRLPRNVGKGGAVTAGVEAAADADAYLLVDADVGASASRAPALLEPVVAGRADMVVGVLPAAGSLGGFGRVRALAASGIRRACGFEARAPLSGQRAVRGELLRSLLPLADRFGLEVGLTVDAVRAGARVEEVDVAMEHRHTGRTPAGFRHRGRQGVDVVRALWPRVLSEGQRLAAIVVVFVLLAGVALWQGSRWEPSSVPPAEGRVEKVAIYDVPGLTLDDLPAIRGLRPGAAVAAMFVRTLGAEPARADGHATLSAGTRVVAGDNRGRNVSSEPGALEGALRAAGRDRALAMTQVDRASLAAELSRVDARTLVFVLSVAPAGTEWNLMPIVAWGPGVRPGYLHSPSTRQEGLVALTDVAPTVLSSLGVATPHGMVGRPLRYRPGPAAVQPLLEMDRDASFRQRWYVPTTVWYVTVQALAYLFAVVAFSRGWMRRWGPWLRWVVLAVSAWPLTTFLWRAIPDIAELGSGAVPVAVAIDVAVVGLALRARRRPLAPLAWICGATVAVILLDVWTGARLQASSLLGYSLQTAGRFTGLGNTTFAVLAATTVVAVCLHVHHAPRRREAVATGAGVCALVVLTDGAPTLGSDVGGILSLVPVFGLLVLVLAGRRLSAKVVAVTALVTVVALAGVALLDYLRPVASRTHLGQLVADMRAEGLSPFFTTVRRKVAGNLRTVSSPWTWTVPVITVYLLWMLGWARGFQRVLPRGSALRTAAMGILALGVLGNVVNDSGVVVTAVVLIFLGPLLTLAAMRKEATA